MEAARDAERRLDPVVVARGIGWSVAAVLAWVAVAAVLAWLAPLLSAAG